MTVMILLIVAGGSVAGGFLAAFMWAVRSGQFDDTTTPPIRVITEDASQTAFREDSVHASDRY
jgi:cbb3-type cytochrome oxidase maturation protein